MQNQFDVINREDPAKTGVIDYCDQIGMAFIAWTPLLKGLLTDKYQDMAAVGQGDRLFDEGTLDAACKAHDFPRIQKLARLATSWDLPLNQLVIAYMLAIPGMGPVIPSVSSVSQLESNAQGRPDNFLPGRDSCDRGDFNGKMNQRKEIMIIGGGVIGVCIAYYLTAETA